MTPETVTRPDPASTAPDGVDVDHLTCCCDVTIALCGVDLTDVPFTDLDETPCPLCFTDEAETPICHRCGRDCEACDFDPQIGSTP